MERGVILGGAMIVISCLIAIALNSHAGREASSAALQAQAPNLSIRPAAEHGCATAPLSATVKSELSRDVRLEVACETTAGPHAQADALLPISK